MLHTPSHIIEIMYGCVIYCVCSQITGWVGVPLLILMGVIAAFSGKRLGDCWSILEERDPQMRSRKRNPYAIIADRALGKTWRYVHCRHILYSEAFGRMCLNLTNKLKLDISLLRINFFHLTTQNQANIKIIFLVVDITTSKGT